MTSLARLALFAVAYAPLPALLTIRLWSSWPQGALAAAVIAALLVVAGAAFLRLIGRGTEADIVLDSVERMSDTAPNFLLGYVLPFLLIDLSDSSAVIAAFAFVGLLGIAYVRGGMLYANPLLTLFGYHIWQVEGRQTPGDDKPLNLVLISRRRDLAVAETVRTIGDEDGIRLVRKPK